MAFLVSYSQTLSDHATNRAIYLDDKFYKLIFRKCRKESARFTVLGEIALLRYKSPKIMLGNDRIEHLIQELEPSRTGQLQTRPDTTTPKRLLASNRNRQQLDDQCRHAPRT